MAKELTPEVRDELLRVPNNHPGCRRAQLSTMLRMKAEMRMRGGLSLVTETNSQATARYLRREIGELHGVTAIATILGDGYEVRVLAGTGTLVRTTGLVDGRGNDTLGLPAAVVGGTLSEVAAAWRGAFLMSGTLTSPGRSAALSIQCPSPETAHALARCAKRMGVLAMVRETRDGDQVLVRDTDSIITLLLRMGASQAVVTWERRSVRQRNGNLDDANARRTAEAAAENCARVERALWLLGDTAPKNLTDTGKLRLAHRGASLEELGRYASPPMSKDSVAGRLRRLLAMADRCDGEFPAFAQASPAGALAGVRV